MALPLCGQSVANERYEREQRERLERDTLNKLNRKLSQPTHCTTIRNGDLYSTHCW
jgi:hypothetical protein